MKKLIFLISIGLIVSAFSTQMNAQNANASEQGWTTGTYWSPIYCDGEMVDLLEGGWLKIHYVIHSNPAGKHNWRVDQLKGEVTSSTTGETFKIRETDRTYFTDHWYVTWHYNLKGDMGTHYTGTLTYSYWDGSITIGNTTCH